MDVFICQYPVIPLSSVYKNRLFFFIIIRFVTAHIFLTSQFWWLFFFQIHFFNIFVKM